MTRNYFKYQVSSILIIILLVSSGLLIINQFNPQVDAISTWTQETESDFENGTMTGVSILAFGKDSELVLNNNYNWTYQTPPRINNPSDRNRHTMASIKGTDKLVLYGGFDGSFIFSQTWIYDLSENKWTKQSPATDPEWRRDYAMASVDGTDQVVFFGGWNGSSTFNDTWVYDFSANTWTQKYPTTSPSIRYYHKMATINGTDKVLLFGGAYGATIFDDTWEYDLSANTWTNKNPSGGSPIGRCLQAMAEINGTDNIVMYGGFNTTPLSETWTYDLSANSWTQKYPSSNPGAIHSHDMASINTDDKVLLFGGWDNTKHLLDTWVYDFSSNNWNKKTTLNRPINTSNHRMASIDNTDIVILFGGNDGIRYYDITWGYDLSNNNWQKMCTPCPPYSRNAHAMATICGTDKLLLFGGNSHRYLSGTWVYDLSEDNWTRKYPADQPSIRRLLAMASIHGDDKVVLFGGSHNSQQTWVYDLSANTWTERSPFTQPSARIEHAMASIYGDDKIVLFGGWDGSSHVGDTWVYDFSSNTWTNKNPSGTKPGTRSLHSMAQIEGDDKVILFGGTDSSFNRLDETWIYDLSANTWTKKNPTTKPNARNPFGLAHIPNTKKVMLFGGFSSTRLDDTWVYDYRANNWAKITMTTEPVARSSQAMAAIDGTDKVVVFGGFDGVDVLDDTWVFGLSSYVTSGTFISEPINFGQNAILTNISWNATNTGNTDVKFKIKTAATEAGLTSKAFVGPDGTTGTFYTSSPSMIWSGHFGDSWVQYIAYLSTTDTTETPRLGEITISSNYLPTTELVSPANDTIMANNKPTFAWNFIDTDSANQIAFQVQISDYNNFQEIDYDSGIQISTDQQWIFPTGTSYTTLSDGTWYWKVRTKDSDGVWGSYSEPYKLIIDVCTPTSGITTPIDSECYNDLDLISGSANDPVDGTGINKVEVAIKRLADNNYWGGSNWLTAETWLTASGTTDWSYDCSMVTWTSGKKYSIQSRCTDCADNVELPGTEIIIIFDTDLPISTINAPVNNVYLSKLHNISGIASDSGGAKLDFVQVQIKDTNDNKYWDGIIWSFQETWLDCEGTTNWFYNSEDVKWSSDVYYTVTSRGTDIAGNIEVPSSGHTFMYDDKAPENLEIKIDNDNVYSMTTFVTLSILAEDSGSGVAQMAFSTDNMIWSSWEPMASSKSFTLSTNDGEKIVYFKVKDNAGNIAEAVSDIIILDSTPPDNLVLEINEDVLFTNSRNVVLDIDATDSISGVFEMSFSDDGVAWDAWESFVSTKSIKLSSGDGEKTVYIKVRDYAGNIATAVSDSIILDTTTPETISVEINGNSQYTNSEYVHLNLTATDSLSGIGEMSFSTDEVTWTTWEAFKAETDFTLPLTIGERTVHFRVRDKAGNIAEDSDSIILDNEPPHSLSIIINDGENETRERTVTLKLSAQDALSGVDQMSFSIDGFTWSPWEPRDSPKSYELQGEYGEKTIYFRVKDKVGNIAEPVSDEIYYVEAPKKDPSKDESDKTSPLTLAAIIIVIVIILIIIVLAIFLTKRKQPKEPEPVSQPYYKEELRPTPPRQEPIYQPATDYGAEPYASPPPPPPLPGPPQAPPQPPYGSMIDKPETQRDAKLTAQDKLDMLDERLLRGDISEETYNRLKAKFDSDTKRY
jgi:uncharacterized membrane protein